MLLFERKDSHTQSAFDSLLFFLFAADILCLNRKPVPLIGFRSCGTFGQFLSHVIQFMFKVYQGL